VKKKDLFSITTGYLSNIAVAVITHLQAVDNFFISDDGFEAPPGAFLSEVGTDWA
jgi:hypothetical protein